MPSSEVAIVVEGYNETEHSSVDRLTLALEAAQRAAAEHGSARVILADGPGTSEVEGLLRHRFPGVERVSTDQPEYDAIKAAAAKAADARIVAYLDGDCVPNSDDWLPALIGPILAGEAVATTGFTAYEGGWLSRVLTVMDFGFLLPLRSHPVGCYVSNNSAFEAEALARTPVPDGELRCRCYAHGQCFERQGEPIQLAPEAAVRHERVPLLAERLRRGWDLVGAARDDPALREAEWLRYGVRAAPLFWRDAIRWDRRRLRESGEDVGLRGISKRLALPVMVALRLIDFVGIVAALRGRPVPLS
jgi:Glycosyl transferase family 2